MRTPEEQVRDIFTKVNPNFDGFVYITDNYHTPPNNWTRIPLDKLIEIVETERQHQAKLEAELAQLQLEVGRLRGALDYDFVALTAYGDKEFIEKNRQALSHPTPPLYSAVVELVEASWFIEFLFVKEPDTVSEATSVPVRFKISDIVRFQKALSNLKKLMGREG